MIRRCADLGVATRADRCARNVVTPWFQRLRKSTVAISVCVIAAAGCALFIAQGAGDAVFTAVALGFAVGAELDLIAYLVARYFGLAQIRRVYGLQYGAFIAASGLGPLWVGALRDATGNYTLPLIISVAGLLAACVAFLLLPRYPPLAAPAATAQPDGAAVSAGT